MAAPSIKGFDHQVKVVVPSGTTGDANFLLGLQTIQLSLDMPFIKHSHMA